jgi:hypothetical protein
MSEDWVIELWDGTEWIVLYYFTGTIRAALHHISEQSDAPKLRVRRKADVKR